MVQLLKVSTAADVILGPFVDSTDGVTAETALTISQADIRLSKNGGAFAQTNNATGATHRENGNYVVPLDATDTNTLGRLRVSIAESGALPCWLDFHVVPANVYDSLIGGTDTLNADVTQFGGTNGTFNGGRPEVNATHWGGTAVGSATVRSDLINIAGAAVNTASAQLGVNVVNFGGSAGTFASGRPEVNASHWGGTAVASAVVSANVTQISGDSVAADNLESAADGTGYNLGGGSIVAASVTGAVGSVTGNVGGNVVGSVGSVVGSVGSVVGSVGSVVGNVGGSVASISGVSFPSNFGTLGINASGHISRVVLCDTITTYTGNTPQTGDSFARIGATGSGLTSLAPAATALSTVQWTTARAGYLDALNGGIVVKRNTALANFEFLMVLSSDHVTGATGKTITATRSIDGGAFASCTNSASEVSNGVYKINLSAADLNGTTVTLRFTASDCDDTFITILTQP